MSLEHLITNRAEQDVERVKFLSEKAWQDMTDAEKSEWLSPMKGAYNYTDMNRVEEAVAFVAERLREFGYLSFAPETHVWSAEDIPTESDLFRYFGNIATLRNAITVGASTPNVPAGIAGFGSSEANALEQILLDVYLVLTRISQAWFYSGDLYSGDI